LEYLKGKKKFLKNLINSVQEKEKHNMVSSFKSEWATSIGAIPRKKKEALTVNLWTIPQVSPQIHIQTPKEGS
jgi:hypothetical protein